MLFRSYLLSLAMTALEAHDWQYIERDNFARTIPIPTLGVGVMDFGISQSLKENLYQAGYEAGKKFLERWDFDGYIEEFRSGKQESRTESIAKQIKQPATG